MTKVTGNVTSWATLNMADADTLKSLNGLLNGIAQKVYYNKSEITEDLLKNELYPELSQEEFHALHEKMKGLVKVIGNALAYFPGFEIFSLVQTSVLCIINLV